MAAQASIDSVTADGKPLPFTFDYGLLQIPLADKASALTITYRIRFDDAVPQSTVGIEDPSFGVTATIMPQGVFLSAVSGWHPQPTGAHSRFRVTIAGPPGWSGVTSGSLAAHESDMAGTRTTWQTQFPQSALTLAAGQYRLQRDEIGGIQILVFTSAENADLAPGYLESCREYLGLYQKLFGSYPYTKFAVVENFFPTGYGLPGWTLLGSSVIKLPFIRTTSLPHEIAHAWWGNAIEIDYQSGNWGEGLATYVADYYLKELHSPEEALDYRRKILRDFAALVDAGDDFPLTAFRSRTTKRNQAIGYGKTAMVFHMLRGMIGDKAFWSGLQTAAQHGLGKRYAWGDLQRHFEAASGLELETFFRQWLDRTGAPLLQLTDVHVDPVANGWQVSGTLRQEAPYYDLAVPLRLDTTSQQYEQTVGLAALQGSFTFTVPDRPVSLTVDPQGVLFRKLYPEEQPATINNLRASRVPLVIVANGSEALLDASRDLLRGLQWSQAPLISESDYLAQQPAERDLLILGWPKSQHLRLDFQAGFQFAAQQAETGENLYTGEEDALFMVTGRKDAQRVSAYFLPGSDAAARDVARRIPHYGRYSYLAFRNGQNQVKSTWEPASSPLKIRFDKDNPP